VVSIAEKESEQANLCLTKQKHDERHHLQLKMLPMTFSHGEVEATPSADFQDVGRRIRQCCVEAIASCNS
jgi:hypothetical protein